MTLVLDYAVFLNSTINHTSVPYVTSVKLNLSLAVVHILFTDSKTHTFVLRLKKNIKYDKIISIIVPKKIPRSKLGAKG